MQLLELFESQSLQVGLSTVHHYLKREYWMSIFSSTLKEIWVHQDDPQDNSDTLGKYILAKTFGNKVDSISYIAPDEKEIHFSTLAQFIEHINLLAQKERITPEGLAKGREQLEKIAQKLRREKDWTDRRKNMHIVKNDS